MRRAPLSLTIAASAALLLAGCSSSGGSQIGDITVKGELGSAPEVTFDTPLAVSESQHTSVIKGDGAVIEKGETVDVEVSLYSGQTGKAISQSDYSGDRLTSFTADSSAILPGLADGLIGSTLGSRVVATIAPKDAFGEDGNQQVGIGANESLVAVMDLVSLAKTKADGEQQPQQDGLPKVSLDDDGKPTVEIPKSDPPKDLTIAVLKKGSGEKVEKDATVTMQYQGTNWRTGDVFDQTWGRGLYTQAIGGFVPGFTKAIEGQTVGSQVLVVIPPSEGYGEAGQESAGIKGDDTMVFVIDILKATK